MSHEWYEILVAADEAEESSRLDFINLLCDQVFIEPTEPGDKGYPEPASVRKSYICRDVVDMMRYQLIQFDVLLDEEKRAVDEAEKEARFKTALEDETMNEMRNAYFDMQNELRYERNETARTMRRMEEAYRSIMTQITKMTASYKDTIPLFSNAAEGYKEILSQLSRQAEDNKIRFDQVTASVEEVRSWHLERSRVRQRERSPSVAPEAYKRRSDGVMIPTNRHEREKFLRACESELREIDHYLRSVPFRERRFGHRKMKEHEKGVLMCVFCKETGSHYSDACSEVRSTFDRKELLRSEHRCFRCLEIHFDEKCSKPTVCFYCKAVDQAAGKGKSNGDKRDVIEHDHHASICGRPEDIMRRIERKDELTRIIEMCKRDPSTSTSGSALADSRAQKSDHLSLRDADRQREDKRRWNGDRRPSGGDCSQPGPSRIRN
ncbi:unnamed protein product [Heligmosomoides polygyrus]|uniref:CCHC-type domain-containing protein n=1 Tax=Heligmosomoides polygyrus TaxID=6339 RepID=A0A183FQF1_HELPZ|nr:unnamed protein product [Heligmosomoides polygyrus]